MSIAAGSYNTNHLSSYADWASFPDRGTTPGITVRHNHDMPRKKSTPPRMLSHHWLLAEWAELKGMRQKDAVQQLGWSKSQASDLFNGKQRYTQDLVDEVLQWLNLAPYELFMHPEDAMAIRDMRRSAARLPVPASFALNRAK